MNVAGMGTGLEGQHEGMGTNVAGAGGYEVETPTPCKTLFQTHLYLLLER